MLKKMIYTFSLVFIFLINISCIRAFSIKEVSLNSKIMMSDNRYMEIADAKDDYSYDEDEKTNTAIYFTEEMDSVASDGANFHFKNGDYATYLGVLKSDNKYYVVRYGMELFKIDKNSLTFNNPNSSSNERGDLRWSKGTILNISESCTLKRKSNLSETKNFEKGTEVTVYEDYYEDDKVLYFEYDGDVYVADSVNSNSFSDNKNNVSDSRFDYGLIPSGSVPDGFMKPVYKIWNTILLAIRIAAFAGIIFCRSKIFVYIC